MSITIDNMKSDSPPSARTTTESAAGISYTRNSLRSKKLLDEMIVGFDDDVKLIKDKLAGLQKKVDVVSIVGMGGIGKTTLATKVFNDGYAKDHFHVRVWVTVFQTYDKRAVLIQILDSICAQLKLENTTTDSKLRELVHKHLMGRRYMIVIDDKWHTQTWDQLKLFFPHDNTGSRILLTSRIVEVAKHANLNGFTHHLGLLNEEKGWELLCRKVFHDINKCPEWLVEPGEQIVKNCKGLPLSVVVVAGILAKVARSKKLWVEIAEKTSSYIIGEQNGCLEILALSYNHLPLHLRECFLYLGGFPEDHKFHVQELIWLWVAEGFIEQIGDGKSLEEITESYLMDLIDRNLVIVSDRRNSNGAVKACTFHDLVRELCMRKAKEKGFILETERLILSSKVITAPHKLVRMFTNKEINIPNPSAHNLRSMLYFGHFKPLTDYITKYSRSFMLLRVLDLQRCSIDYFPEGMKMLVHLRYLAIWKDWGGFPSSICTLWGLQTLIYITRKDVIELPRNISDLVNLRHLWSYFRSSVGNQRYNVPFYLSSIKNPMNLRTTANVKLGDEAGNFQKCFPYIKELKCTTDRDEECDLKSLTCLEKLKLTDYRTTKRDCITFPTTLRALKLYCCRLPWSHMSIIQSLPNLQFLKLKSGAFDGSCWNTVEQEFRQLKFLRLQALDIKQWEAYAQSFPCLRQLEVYSCRNLEEIPLDIGDIQTLELIKINWCKKSVSKSVRRIEQEQNDLGNFDLTIEITND